MILADVQLNWLPPIATDRLALAALVAVGAVFFARLFIGGPSRAARSPVLLILRGLIFAALALLLFNPVRVETTPGEMSGPDVIFLYDASESMALGEPASRWDLVGRFIAEAETDLQDAAARILPYAFGRRLRAVEAPSSEVVATSESNAIAASHAATTAFASLSPRETDTQLEVALRQLTGRIGREPPAGVVLFSDGRTRDPEAAVIAASAFAELQVPVHIVPMGKGAGGGDVAIVGVAAPERVRKYSENQITAFLRSFGYDGDRVEVQLVALADGRSPEQTLATLPVTLTGGVQSVTLPFQSELRSRTLRVAVSPRDNEVAASNNNFDVEVEVDRTKIRVLYVEGSDQPVRFIPREGSFDARGPHTLLQEALSEDPDIECVALVAGGERQLRLIDRAVSGTLSQRGFPTTTAELFAFDAIILSDVDRELFTDEQLERLERWIGRRGGGLCMVGGPKSFADGAWSNTVLADLLPVQLRSGGTWHASPATLRPAGDAAAHPLWQISDDASQNRSLVESIPPVPGHHGPLLPKPDLAETIGTAEAANDPLVVAGRYGRGRTMAISLAIAAPPGADALVNEWGATQGAYYGKFWRNAVYWLTENSSIGRRRLLAETDKQFYRPEDTVAVRADAFDEAADKTNRYRVVAMVEPKSLDFDFETLDSPLLWPQGVARTSGEDSPYVLWGEEIELRPGAGDLYGIDLTIAAPIDETADLPAVRLEVTAYEGQTQVDSTSVDLQILDDPFERRSPFPDHELLEHIAKASGGTTFASATQLADWIDGLPVSIGPESVDSEPVWNRWPVLLGLLGLITADWLWRRKVGLA